MCRTGSAHHAPYRSIPSDVLAEILSGLEDGTVVLDEQLTQAGDAGGGSIATTSSAATGERSRRLEEALGGCGSRCSRHRHRMLIDDSKSESVGPVNSTAGGNENPPAASSTAHRSLSSALRTGQQQLQAYYSPDVSFFLCACRTYRTPAVHTLCPMISRKAAPRFISLHPVHSIALAMLGLAWRVSERRSSGPMSLASSPPCLPLSGSRPFHPPKQADVRSIHVSVSLLRSVPTRGSQVYLEKYLASLAIQRSSEPGEGGVPGGASGLGGTGMGRRLYDRLGWPIPIDVYPELPHWPLVL